MAKRTQAGIILDDEDFNIVKIYDDVDPNQDIYDFIKKRGYITTFDVRKMRNFASMSSAQYVLNNLNSKGKLLKYNVMADLRGKDGVVKKTEIIIFKLPPKPLKNK